MHNEIFCKKCGKIALPDSKFCEYCGTKLDTNFLQTTLTTTFLETGEITQQPQYEVSQDGQQVQYPSNQQPSYIPENQPKLPRKNPIISAILSLLIAGLGQIYLGRFRRGAAWFIGGVILGILSGGVLAIFVWIGAAVDAYLLAKNYNRKLGYLE